jgi:dienelactone hydrolase
MAGADVCVCVRGFTDVGTPRGEDGHVGGCPAYLVRPPAAEAPTRALIICPDIFGHTPTNVRLIADRLAEEAGLLVVVPDLYDGDAVPLSFLNNRFDLQPWFQRHGDAAVLPHLRAIVTALGAQGCVRVGAQGYCWGGRFAILLGGQEQLAHVVVACHPSRVAMPQDVEALQAPALFCCAEVKAATTRQPE